VLLDDAAGMRWGSQAPRSALIRPHGCKSSTGHDTGQVKPQTNSLTHRLTQWCRRVAEAAMETSRSRRCSRSRPQKQAHAGLLRWPRDAQWRPRMKRWWPRPRYCRQRRCRRVIPEPRLKENTRPGEQPHILSRCAWFVLLAVPLPAIPVARRNGAIAAALAPRAGAWPHGPKCGRPKRRARCCEPILPSLPDRPRSTSLLRCNINRW
jgi:hypothetical protein